MTKFALIGVGFIAEKHLKAIKEVGGDLLYACDTHDSVGILDRYFPDCVFSLDQLHFIGCDYVSICSPNYLHGGHIREVLFNNSNAICEKPLVLNIDQLGSLKKYEKMSGKRVFTILQMRLDPRMIRLKESLKEGAHSVTVKYVAPRGDWYQQSWKGNKEKSGGICTNIGIHIFDLLIWMFGSVKSFDVKHEEFRSFGILKLERASVEFLISTKGKAERKLSVDGVAFDLTVDNLHTESYRQILAGKGFGIEDVREVIQLCENMRKEK